LSGSAPHPEGSSGGLGQAILKRRRRFSFIWLVPIVAGFISIYLAVTYLADRGPLITITFKTANGITAGQTEVKHKAVSLGMVENVHLSDDFKHVLVHVRINREGAKIMTDHARFWVVRPRLSTGNISGLETLLSGAYIEVDPGDPGGTPESHFTGLEDPPGVRSDEPGSIYVLKAARLGSIGPGAPVFYRDVTVGEVLSYDLGNGLGPVAIRVFVRSPFDKFVHDNTHFFNASGISVSLGPEGVHVEMESLQALLSGGIAFETPRFLEDQKQSAADNEFQLFNSKAEADSAGYSRNVPFVTYFTSSVAGLGRGSVVEIFGLQIGTVTDVRLVMDPVTSNVRARVAFNVQPERVRHVDDAHGGRSSAQIAAALVNQGMRAVLESSNFITGQKDISLQYVPNAAPAALGREGDSLVMPSQPGGLDNITTSLSDITTKLDKIPFDEIGQNLSHLLKSVDSTVSGPDVQNALRQLSATLTDVQHLVRHADEGLTPALKRLPQISEDLQHAVHHADALLGDGGYGGNSDFQRNLSRLLDQVSDAARSIRMLADFLDRHPEALIRGRMPQLGAGFLAMVLTACASPDPDYYTLEPVPGAVVQAPPQVIELRRPGLAGYLDRSDIVLKDAGYRLSVNSQQRWAEPIGDMIGRVLTQDLSQRLPASTVFNASGAITADPTLRIEIDIQRFDQGEDGRITMVAEAALEAGRSHTPLQARQVMVEANPAGPGAANLVAAMSGLLGQLADRMAQEVGRAAS
jgi:paraquat-inducible protein B